MLNKNVKVRVTRTVGSFDKAKQLEYGLNFGKGMVFTNTGTIVVDTYIIGVSHPVKRFEGKVIAVLRRYSGSYAVIAAAKNSRYVNYQIEDAIAFAEKPKSYRLNCLYESSCGAVVFRRIDGDIRFLLIKNCKSSHWGFPKGHMERGEDHVATAKREVLEETGLRISVFDGFYFDSNYTIAGKVEKSVRIFLGTTEDTQTRIQREEIDDYTWLRFDDAKKALNFDNDKKILTNAKQYMSEKLNIEA